MRLSVRAPADSAQGLALLAAGRADLAVLDVHDLALARQRGRDLVGVAALVQRPLAALIAERGIGSPRALEARRVGVTGVPSDGAVLRSIVQGAGGDPGRVRTITIGFGAVPSLLAGRVAAAMAFWNVEGVALSARRPGFHAFRVDDYGAPRYPELVVCVTRRTLERRRATVRRVLRALAAGYVYAARDPRGAARALVRASRGLDPALTERQVSETAPAFLTADRRWGELAPAALRAWATWEVRFGIVRRRPDVARTFDRSLLGPPGP